MSFTNFAAQDIEHKIAWSRDVWREVLEKLFIKKFLGSSSNSMIQRVTELTKTESGDELIMSLVNRLVKDGGRGDDKREGLGESMKSSQFKLLIDLMFHSVEGEGKLSDQKSIIKFRDHGKTQLSDWLADRLDQIAFLVMSGVSLGQMCDGSARDTDSPFPNYTYADLVSAPSVNRSFNWDGTALLPGDTTAVAATFLPKYKMIVDAIARGKTNHMPTLRLGGKEYYNFIMHPLTLAQLKMDENFQRALTSVAAAKGLKSPWFTGATVTIDGAVIHEHNNTYNTGGAASGSAWGADGLIDGTRTLMCGAQALAMADLGPPQWSEKVFEYDSKPGINVDKFVGFVKPKHYSTYTKTTEDFSIMAIDHYLPGGRTS